MTIRKIHVPVIGHYGTEELKIGSETALRVGLTFGRAHKAHVEYLHCHGVRTRVVEVARSSHDIDSLLLKQAHEADVGLLIMGAYTRGWLRRIIFGGATGGVLAAASLPVLLVD